MALTPAVFTCALPDDHVVGLIQPSHWNRVTDLLGALLDGADTHGSLLYRDTANVTSGASWLPDVATGRVLVSGGVGVAPAWSATPTLSSLTLSTPLTPANGGTGVSSYVIGDLLYASGAAALSALADVAAGSFLRSGGVGVAPVWSTTSWPNSATTGDLLYASGANAYANLADVAAGSVLVSGGVGVAPAWSATPTLSTLTITQGTIAAAATALSITSTWNNAGVTFSGLKVNITSTASATASLLFDVQKAGISQFAVTVGGNVSVVGAVQAGSGSVIGWNGKTRFVSGPVDGNVSVTNNAGTSFGLLQFGGTTSSFPAVKRSSADLQIRLADDSGYATLDAAAYKQNGTALSFPVVCSNTSASTAITGTSTETAFDLNCKIPAGTLVAGSTIVVDLRGIYNGNASDTLIFKLKACTVAGCGSGTVVTLATTSAVTLAAVSNQYWDLQSQLIAWTVGASGTIEAQTKGLVASTGIAATPLTAPSTATATFDTTVDEYLTATVKFSSASGSNSSALRSLRVVQQ